MAKFLRSSFQILGEAWQKEWLLAFKQEYYSKVNGQG